MTSLVAASHVTVFDVAIFHEIELQYLNGGTTMAGYRYRKGECTTMSVNIRVRVKVSVFQTTM